MPATTRGDPRFEKIVASLAPKETPNAIRKGQNEADETEGNKDNEGFSLVWAEQNLCFRSAAVAPMRRRVIRGCFCFSP